MDDIVSELIKNRINLNNYMIKNPHSNFYISPFLLTVIATFIICYVIFQ
jgi:hypothetical protein